jgi:hypothetical protein
VPITIYLDGYKPDPETKRVMGVAFEAARIALRLADRGDAFAPIVAKKIIELAKEGERNPDLLCERALKDLREPPLRHDLSSLPSQFVQCNFCIADH